MKPTTTGAWWMRSSETNMEWQPVEILKKKGVLIVDDAMLGTCELDAYHDGLIDIEWRKDMEP